MEKEKLEKAFESLKREDLEDIILSLNEDFYIGRMIEEKINKILTPENVNGRLIEEAIQRLSEIKGSLKEIENETSRHSFGIQFNNKTTLTFFKMVTSTLNQFIPLFIDKALFKEGVRFIVAIKTIVDTSSSEEIVELSNNFNYEPYYEKIVKCGNLEMDKVLHFRNLFEGRRGFSIKEIFIGETISL